MILYIGPLRYFSVLLFSSFMTSSTLSYCKISDQPASTFVSCLDHCKYNCSYLSMCTCSSPWQRYW